MTAPAALELFLNRARRRVLMNVIVEQASVAFCVAAAAAILLLVLGTQILNWYWPLLLAVVAASVGLWRARRKMPGLYRIAQIIDARLGLHDALSTAYHFLGASKSSEIIDLQRVSAGDLASTVDVRAAFPVHTPRSTWLAAGLMAIVAGMFGVRYGITHSLDLQKPITPIEFSLFKADDTKKQAYNKKSLVQEKIEEQLKQLGIPLDQMEAPAAESDQVKTKTTDVLATPEGKDALQGTEDGQSIGNKPSESPSEQGDSSEKGEAASSGKQNETGSEEGSAGSPEQAGQQGKPQENAQNGKTGSNSNEPNLASKLRDALANLMSKLKTPSKSSENGQQSQSAPANGQGQKPQQTAANQKGQQGKSQGEGQGDQNQQGDEKADAGDQGQSGQSKSGDKSSEHAANQDSKSGIGKQDGDKSVKDAEQLAAMGRISELLGRRSQQVTGEMTVEVPSGKQQLKTAYSQKKAAHSDAGSETNRDEVPLIYQPYVQKYFEEVRKVPSPAVKKN